ncbi:hypothetical protein EBX31_00880 [bacterium]|nr:hypothetical protein [bacterium]
MKLKPLYLLAFSLFNFCCQAQATAPASQIIYQYNFSGSASTSVLGQAPDVRPSNEVFVSNDTLSQSDTIKADGAVTGDTRPSYYLPFRVAAGRKNIVSMDVQLNPGNPAGEHWYGLCFARGATLPVADGGLASAYGAMFLLRENGQAQFLSWGTQAGSESRTLNATSGRMEIVLDNTNPANTDLWVVEFRINGGLVFSTQYNGGNFNPDSSDPIQWVGFGKWGPTQGKMDNFTVQVTPAVASVVGVDSTTLTGKVMCGYQGWFTAPITGDSRWIHWGGFRAGDDHASPDGTNLLTDMYPDMREFDADELIPTAMTIGSGSAGAAAPLYSGSNPKTVRRHVRWMQEYGIDGVFAQRFIHEHMGEDTSYKQQLNKTLWSIKNGCQEYGRVFAVMYDISGPADDDLWVTALKNDWMALVDQGLTTGGRYLQQNGKPIVAIWGPGFTDRIPANPATALALINWFKSEAPAKYRASVMGGVPGQWRTLNGDSRTDTAWGDVYRAYDVISPWTVGRYNNNAQIDTWKTSRVVPDIVAAVAAGRAYGTVVWPGFSWKNLNNGTLNQIPRNGGAFYWRQIYNACAAGTTFIYVAMFDEVNEGTAITKVAENAAQAPNQGSWVNMDADGTALPSDWYLRLTYEAGRMLRDPATLTATLPTAPGPQTVTGLGLSNTWDGGGGSADDTWSNPLNWVGDVEPNYADPLNFTSAYVGAANSAYQYSEPAPTIKGLNFLPSAGAFTLLGSPIVLDGDIANQSTRIQTISLNMDLGSGTRTIAATAGDILLSGSNIGTAQIRKTGDYRLTLSAWNRHTGGTEVVAGTLTFLGVQGEEGNIAGNLTIRAGATVYLNDGWSLGYSGDSTRSVTSITIQGGSLVVGANNTGGTSAQTITMTGGSISQLGDRDFDWYLGNGGVSANPTLRTLASSESAVVAANFDLRLGAGNKLTLDVARGSVSGGADLHFRGSIQDGGETGGVIKNGSGKVIFAGANTYSGNTSVNAGTVELAANGIQQFKILGDGVNNTINGAGTVNLLGSLAFDLAGAGNGYPNTWTIVATGGARTYGAEFNVLGFSNMGDGTWRRPINDRIYEFSQATGQLRTTEFGATDPLYTYLRTAMTSDGYIVSSTDLLQTSLSSTASTGDFTREACAGLPALIDGEFGPAGTSTGAQADSATCQVGEIITYTLNTSTNLRGYNISKIVSHTGWDQNRFGQRYDVEVHKVGAPAGAFLPLVSVDYRPSSSGTSSAEVTVTGLSGFSEFNTGTLASGVDQIRFIFKNGSNYGHSMYRELDVIGTPTSLGGLGLSFTGGGFELPYLGAGNFQQGTAATGWTSIKKNVGTTVDYGGGILSNGSPYGNPPAPQGEQVALLKGPGGIEQVIAGFEVGKTYTISFKAIGRSTFGDANPFQVLLDGQLLSFSGLTTIQPPKTEYTPYAGTFTARNSTMTLAFLSTSNDGVVDFSSYVDDVQIQDVPNAPVITSLGGILTGTVGDPFSYAITVTPDPATYPTTYQLTGALPAGLTLNSTTGVISGTPTLAEDRSVFVTATNTGGTSTALSLQIQITGGAIDPYDQWLALYPGLSNTSGSTDPDQDGWTNHQEFLFGGDPTIASAGILTATRSGTQILFTFVARRTGATYAITSSTTLGSGAWLGDSEAEASLGTATDQTGVANPTDYVRRQFSVVPATKKFYRVEASTVVP